MKKKTVLKTTNFKISENYIMRKKKNQRKKKEKIEMVPTDDNG